MMTETSLRSSNPHKRTAGFDPEGPSFGVGVVSAGAPAVAAPAELAAANFRLQASDYNPVIADLDAVLPKASIATVVDSANRKGASCRPHPDAVAAFCWQSSDDATTD